MKKVAAGDEDSFRQLFNHYSDAVFTVAFTYCKSIELSEEIVQDVFLKVWLKKEELENVERFSGYLFVIARNHILNVLRKKAREPHFVAMLENNFLAYTEEADEDIVSKESGTIITEALKELPPQQQTAFRLCRIEGLSQQQVAEQMNISRLTVKYHVQQALRSIRGYIKKKNAGLIFYIILLVFTR